MFLKISQNSQENVCARVSFSHVPEARNFIKKRPWHWCFPVNFAKFLRTTYFTEPLRVTASEAIWEDIEFDRSVFNFVIGSLQVLVIPITHLLLNTSILLNSNPASL